MSKIKSHTKGMLNKMEIKNDYKQDKNDVWGGTNFK